MVKSVETKRQPYQLFDSDLLVLERSTNDIRSHSFVKKKITWKIHRRKKLNGSWKIPEEKHRFFVLFLFVEKNKTKFPVFSM